MTKNDLLLIYQDDAISVFNKPSGMVVNRSNTYSGVTVQDVIDDIADIAEPALDFESENDFDVETDFNNDRASDILVSDEFESRSGIVHRLDKDTSGLLIIARTKEAFQNLQKQFKDSVVSKEYKAVLFGHVFEDKLEVDAPIARNPNNRLSLSIVSTGRPSHTYVEKIKALKMGDSDFTYVLVRPTTGRTHQIRVHMTAINRPVAFDPIYNTKKQFEVSSKYFNRLMLHAHKVSFLHPTTAEKISFEAPLPDEFLKIVY